MTAEAAAGPHAPRRHRPAGEEGGRRYRIGEVARLIGVSSSALRAWERQGLVRPTRTSARYRVYTDADLAILRRVSSMREERVNAPGIRRLLGPRPAVAADVQGHVDGAQLRRLRIAHGRSLREAATASGVSVSFLSALERNASGASVATLQRVLAAYGATVLDLFPRRRPGRRLVRPVERPILEVGGDGVRIEQLASGSAQLEPQLFVLAPGATSDGAYAHAGEEFLFVLHGALTVWVGDSERYAMRTGDALTFPSTLEHRWRNSSREETRLLWINTPPTF